MKNILLTLMIFGSFGAFADEDKYLICKHKSILPVSRSSHWNVFIKYFPRENTQKVKEYPSQWPYRSDDEMRSGPGIQVQLSVASPSESKDDPTDIWEFKTWEFWAAQETERYFAPWSSCCNKDPMFNLNRKTLKLLYRSEIYSELAEGIRFWNDEAKCSIVSKKVFDSSLEKAKEARLKRNKKLLKKNKEETKI